MNPAITQHRKPKQMNQMRGEGGTPLRMRIREKDLVSLEQIKKFYRERFHLDPSNSVLVRTFIERHAKFITGVIESLDEGTPLEEIPEMGWEEINLISAARND